MAAFITRIRSLLIAVSIFLTSFLPFAQAGKIEMPSPQAGEYGQWVDPFIGTGGIPWTCAMVSPCATAPFGSVRLGADTCFAGGSYLFKTNTSGYYYNQNYVLGFSHARLSGTGIEDLGTFRVTPAVGGASLRELRYSHSEEVASPGYYALWLPGARCLAEMTATAHAGVHRYTFNSDADAHLWLDITSNIGGGSAREGRVTVNPQTGEITGECLSDTGFAGRYGGLRSYFVARFDTPFKDAKIQSENGAAGTYEGSGDDLTVNFNFGNMKGKSVQLKLAISYVSLENARENFNYEVGTLDFDGVRSATRSEWERRLSSVQLTSDDSEIKTIFYTSLYHAMIMPTNFTDVNGEYLGFDGKVGTVQGYTYRTDMSLWDTYRTTHPLYTLIAPDVQADCLKSLVEMAKAGGSLPRWPSGAGYTGSMFGTPADMVIAESYLKDYTDFDVEAAFGYMKLTSDSLVEKGNNRTGVEEYNSLGYVPADVNKSVSRTMEYSWADGSIALLAQALGRDDDAAKYRAKSMNYKNLFDTETKYFRPRNADGSWYKPFSPSVTSFIDEVLIGDYRGYCEGSARQWRWSAVHDVDGMIELFGSKEYFVSELEEFMQDASANRAALNPGDGYWIGNQHDIHTPYLFNNAGRADLAQKWVRWTLSERFGTDINGLDGNDDGGTISAWYVLSAVGIYPMAGSANYWLGSPNINRAVLNLGGGKTLTVIANNQSEDNIYVQSATLNGERLVSPFVTHSQLTSGNAVLTFNMGSAPAANGGYAAK